jgi:hypothetical protein
MIVCVAITIINRTVTIKQQLLRQRLDSDRQSLAFHQSLLQCRHSAARILSALPRILAALTSSRDGNHGEKVSFSRPRNFLLGV